MTVGVESSTCVWPQGPQPHEKQHWKLPRSPACMAAFARMHILRPRMAGCLHHDGAGWAGGDWPRKANWVALVYMMMAVTYDTMSGHGEAVDAHRVVCPNTLYMYLSYSLLATFRCGEIQYRALHFCTRGYGLTVLNRIRPSLLKTKQIIRDYIEVQYYIFVPAGTVWLTKVLNRIRYWSK